MRIHEKPLCHCKESRCDNKAIPPRMADSYTRAMTRGLLRLTKVLLAMTLIYLCSSCTSKEIKPTTAPIPSTDELPSQTSAHTRMSFSTDGKIRAVMNAKGVRTFEQKRYTLLDSSVHVDFFDRDANHSSLLTSRRAYIDDNSHNMTAYDSVRVLSDSGTLVETDSLLG